MCLFWLQAAAERAPALDLQQWAAMLGGVRESQARFVETKHLALLERPLRLEGTLSFRAPDYLRKQVTAPEPQDFEVEGERVTIRGPQSDPQVLALDRYPALRAFVEALRASLRGDVETLRRFYDVQLSGTADDWRLHLVPRNDALARRILHVDVVGSGAELFSIEIVERDGDRSLMRIRADSR